VVPVAADVLELVAEPLAERRVAEPRDRRVGAARHRPARQERVQVRGAGQVRVRVERDLDAGGAGPGGEPGGVVEEDLGVTDMEEDRRKSLQIRVDR